MWEAVCRCVSRAALRKKQQNMEVHKKVKLPRATGTGFSVLCIRGPDRYHESTQLTGVRNPQRPNGC